MSKTRKRRVLKEVHEEILVPRAVERGLRRKPEGDVIFRDNPYILCFEFNI